MKEIILTVSLVLLTFIGFSQATTDVVIENLEGTKSELYTKTKMYISENMVGSNLVVSDEDNGVIVITNTFIQSVKSSTWNIDHTFLYRVKFYHKDGKVRCVIELTTLSESLVAYQNATGTTLGVISGSAPIYKEYTEKNSAYRRLDMTGEFPGLMKCGFGKNKFYEMVDAVMSKPKNVITQYSGYMKTNQIGVSNW